MKRLWLSMSFVALVVATLSADNWPQWRGPQLNGVSTETGIPLKWTSTSNVAWKLPLRDRKSVV